MLESVSKRWAVLTLAPSGLDLDCVSLGSLANFALALSLSEGYERPKTPGVAFSEKEKEKEKSALKYRSRSGSKSHKKEAKRGIVLGSMSKSSERGLSEGSIDLSPSKPMTPHTHRFDMSKSASASSAGAYNPSALVQVCLQF
jgi:hypothetical protein